MSVLGVTKYSLPIIYDLLKRKCKEHNVKFGLLADNFASKSIYLAPNGQKFKHFIPELLQRKSEVIVCDGLLELEKFSGIDIIDKGETSFQKLEATLDSIVTKIGKKKPDPINCTEVNYQLIDRLIEEAQKYNFLDKLNGLVYKTIDQKIKNHIKSAIIQFLFKNISLVELERRLCNNRRLRSETKKAIQNILDYLVTTNGKNLKLACKASIKNSDLAGLSRKFLIDLYELEYLVRLSKSIGE